MTSPLPDDVHSRPSRSDVLLATLRCYLCSETRGTLESSPGSLPSIAQFTPADGSAARLVVWRGLQCRRCGSRSLFVDDVELVTRRPAEPVDLFPNRPRRGRPPRGFEQRPRRGLA